MGFAKILLAVVVAAAALGVRFRGSGRSRPLFACWYAWSARRAERGEIGRRRRALLAHASGWVLDVGVGTGEAFKHLPPAVSGVVAVEPDPEMLRRASQRAVETGAPVGFVRAVGEALPFSTEAFDTAVVMLVLCTVEDLEASVAELYRVLRPGGRLLLLEHVRASDEALAGLQDFVEQPWSWCNGGCRPNRRTLEALQGAGFTIRDLDRYGFPALPHVQGIALRA